MQLKPGGIRELHWHAIAAEWALVIKGTVLATVIVPNGQPATDIFEPGDIWYFPKGHGHALQNISNEEAHFVLGFDEGHFSEFGTFSITDWIAHTPQTVVSRNLGLSSDAIRGLPKKELYILPGRIPPAVPERYHLKRGSQPLAEKGPGDHQIVPLSQGLERRAAFVAVWHTLVSPEFCEAAPNSSNLIELIEIQRPEQGSLG